LKHKFCSFFNVPRLILSKFQNHQILVDPTGPLTPEERDGPRRLRPPISFTYRGGVLGPGATQSETFDTVARPLVRLALSGVNASLIAYGQTSSGKTHTMAGSDAWVAHVQRLGRQSDNSNSSGNSGNSGGGGGGDAAAALAEAAASEGTGVVARFALLLFDEIRAGAAQGTDTECAVSFVEIYNETLRDLLGPTAQVKLQLRERRGKGLWAPGATSVPVRSAEEVLAVSARGEHRRAKAHTRSNERSSRSHSIFIITIRTTCEDTAESRVSQVYLVDLAGSERHAKSGAEGQRLVEASGINTSLLALGNVIERLAKHSAKQSGSGPASASATASASASASASSVHVPFRDSLLTRVLQLSLAGGGVTHLLVCASESTFQARETVASLRFGDRAARIRGRASVVTAVVDPEVLRGQLREARDEITRLRAEIASLLRRQSKAVDASSSSSLSSSSSSSSSSVPGASPRMCTAECAARSAELETLRRAAREAEAERQREAERAADDGSINQGFFCPITREIFVDPVVAADGQTYERAAIVGWLAAHGTSPLRGGQISSETLITNWSMRSMIAADPHASRLATEAAGEFERESRVARPPSKQVAKLRGLVLFASS
jgi:hypothetical protein